MPTPPTVPTAPTGYNLVPRDSSVPSFIRQAVGPVKEQVSPALTTDTPTVETVAEAHPGVISVYDPKKYTPQIRNHEMTHEFQATRSNGNIPLAAGYELKTPWGTSSSAPMKYEAGSPKNYDYGGEAGLAAMLKSGKTAANLNQEQQADAVADYKAKQNAYLAKVKAGKATPADLKAMYATHQTYHPFMQQMANLPSSLRNSMPSLGAILGIGKPQPLAPAPAAPGLPSYETKGLGVAPADPLMGGQSVPTGGAVKGQPALSAGDGHAKSINPYRNPEDQPPDMSLTFNKNWTKPGWKLTTLSPQEEAKFQAWAKQNPKAVQGELNNPKADYDVRAHWAAAQRGDPAATLVLNKWDGKMHGNDKFKTPYNGGFSNESMYATPNAPRWVGNKLMTSDGKLVTDETPAPKHKIGDKINFKNGKIGVWDGHGWLAQQ